MGAEVYAQAVDLDPVKGETLPAGRSLTSGEIMALMEACAADQSPTGARDAALIGVLYSGLRRAEVVTLDLADFDPETRTLRVKGKRRKERMVPVVNGAALALADWLLIRGTEPGPLFLPTTRGGKVRRHRLTAQTVYDLLRRRASEAGLESLSPHDFRRTVAGDLLDSGADVITVQRILGHESADTTGRYDRRPESAKSRAMNKLHLPYRRRTLTAGADEKEQAQK
jgi:site-specific recombinase XerD